jgi:hypothetical protein
MGRKTSYGLQDVVGKDGREDSKCSYAHSRNGLKSREQVLCIGKTDFGEFFELTRPAEGGESFGRGLAKANGFPAEDTAKSKT